MASVIAHANEKIGQRVGDGECTRVAEYALKQAGMKTTSDYGVTGGRGVDYVWGTNILADNALPGDILQFRNHVMVVTRRRPDGTLIESRDYRRGHHTAILASKNVRYQGERRYFSYSILEQHCCGKSVVHKGVIQVVNSEVSTSTEDITTEVFGTVQFYRPVPK